jgi:hypothetical protein
LVDGTGKFDARALDLALDVVGTTLGHVESSPRKLSDPTLGGTASSGIGARHSRGAT